MLCKINPDIYISNVNRLQAGLDGQRSNLATSKSNLTRVKATFKNIEASYKRNESLFKSKAISQSEWDAIQSQYDGAKADVDAAEDNVSGAEFAIKSAEASLKEARDNLGRTTIFAPVDGTVSKLNNKRGERVVGTAQMAGTEIMRIADLTEMEVQVDVNENDIVRVHLGDTTEISIDAYGERKFKGVVTDIANSANNSTTLTADQVTNFPVKVRILRTSYEDLLKNLKTNESPFRPGMTASVDIKTKIVTNVISVPIQAVTTASGMDDAPQDNPEDGPPQDEKPAEETNKKEVKAEIEEVVYIFDNGKAKKVAVKTGVQDNTFIEILSGVKDGDEIIAGPYRVVSKQLKDGAEVEKKPKDDFTKNTGDQK
ncbi:MAG: efflux RND transporter periplasmic adaptor subunit [Sphingobacteriales bacterium JAD_PAG50586_3]|nr:MAG: efflux RND transporter periplasmic adaptor subunit [Sphingobacteriales bacterium JAD_PAG50586_3]